MLPIIKRLIAILSGLFLPVFVSAFFSGIFIYILCKLYCHNHPESSFSVVKTTFFLYAIYMDFIWIPLIFALIANDFYLYILKGYKYSLFILFAVQATLVFIILYFFSFAFFQDNFMDAFQVYHPWELPPFTHIWLFSLSTIIVAIPCLFLYFELHRRWIIPHYTQ